MTKPAPVQLGTRMVSVNEPRYTCAECGDSVAVTGIEEHEVSHGRRCPECRSMQRGLHLQVLSTYRYSPEFPINHDCENPWHSEPVAASPEQPLNMADELERVGRVVGASVAPSQDEAKKQNWNRESIVTLIFEEMLERDWSITDIARRMGGKTPEEIGLDHLALQMYLVVANEGVLLGEESARKLSNAFGLSEEFFVKMENYNPPHLTVSPSGATDSPQWKTTNQPPGVLVTNVEQPSPEPTQTMEGGDANEPGNANIRSDHSNSAEAGDAHPHKHAVSGESRENWRLLAWEEHGCSGKYGDDDEMQCNAFGVPIDFKRDAYSEIVDKCFIHRGNLFAEQTKPGESREEFERSKLRCPTGRNIEAELLDELLKVLAAELQCGQNAYEIRQKISELRCGNRVNTSLSPTAPIAAESTLEAINVPMSAKNAAEILDRTARGDAPVSDGQAARSAPRPDQLTINLDSFLTEVKSLMRVAWRAVWAQYHGLRAIGFVAGKTEIAAIRTQLRAAEQRALDAERIQHAEKEILLKEIEQHVQTRANLADAERERDQARKCATCGKGLVCMDHPF